MKHNSLIVLFAAITLLFTGQLFAFDEDRGAGGAGIVRMWKAGVSADTILFFIRQEGAVFSADDVAVIAEAGLPDRFIRDLIKSANSSRDSGDARSYPAYYPTPHYYPYYNPGYPRWFYGGPYLGIHLGGHDGGHNYGLRYRDNIPPHGSTSHNGGRAHSGVWGSGGHSAQGHSGGGLHGSSHAGGGRHGH